MKVFLAASLTFVATLEYALSLQCYTCNDPSDLDNCMFITNCSVETTACKTMVHSVDSGYPLFGNMSVSKTCSEKCVPTDPDRLGDSHPVYCCYTDLCNVSGASQATASFSAMPFMAATVFVLFEARV
ncbi:secreted Ly-6/uPAR-related protein 1-like [Eublepharis macularius]|uniref:Secreted Ly-6/uPAR-related protein 1-like n=1 Tax=Eublepharis macularius TaxID=481883 RepID=A0AA97JS18_EUBMA|nr:secreted Ly-6/uPAR-related protein 1-like [Eublepharis macularius]